MICATGLAASSAQDPQSSWSLPGIREEKDEKRQTQALIAYSFLSQLSAGKSPEQLQLEELLSDPTLDLARAESVCHELIGEENPEEAEILLAAIRGHTVRCDRKDTPDTGDYYLRSDTRTIS